MCLYKPKICLESVSDIESCSSRWTLQMSVPLKGQEAAKIKEGGNANLHREKELCIQ